MGETARWTQLVVNVVRWTGRVLGGLVATFFLIDLIASGLGGESGEITVADAVGLASIVVMVIALVVGWFWEGIAATTLIAAYAVLTITQGRLVPGPFLIFPIVGLMFAFCFWRSRKAPARQEVDRRRAAKRLAILAGTFLGLMAIAGGLLALMSIPGPVIASPPEWVGDWRGEFDVGQRWWPAGVQPVTLNILADGKVEGTLGGAVLVDGQMRQTNRILIWIGHRRRLINAGLEGWVVEEEGISAESVTFRLRSLHGRFELSLEAQGGTLNGEEFGAATSNRFFLQRVN